jgi:hypothetical protein
MSVIAKMNILACRAFGTGQLVELGCVCENDLMAMHTPSNEDVTFSKASPSGDARLHVASDVVFRSHEQLYLIFARAEAAPAFDDAIIVVPARCVSITDYGGTSKRVEIASRYRYHKDPKAHPLEPDAFNMVIQIDNPAASLQFEPGEHDYWVGIYRCIDHSMSDAIRLARA